jgi:ribosomal protein S18 acetylase RimI-like enzyme
MALVTRRGVEGDLEAVRRIQARSAGAAQWPPEEYLDRDFRVAVDDGQVVGFLVARRLAEGESEILNLAVDPGSRRKGVAWELVRGWVAEAPGAVFLEVRESNQSARSFYQAFGFQEVGCRVEYYNNPLEAAIVLKFHSC